MPAIVEWGAGEVYALLVRVFFLIIKVNLRWAAADSLRFWYTVYLPYTVGFVLVPLEARHYAGEEEKKEEKRGEGEGGGGGRGIGKN